MLAIAGGLVIATILIVDNVQYADRLAPQKANTRLGNAFNT
jgi:hypothetical protein